MSLPPPTQGRCAGGSNSLATTEGRWLRTHSPATLLISLAIPKNLDHRQVHRRSPSSPSRRLTTGLETTLEISPTSVWRRNNSLPNTQTRRTRSSFLSLVTTLQLAGPQEALSEGSEQPRSILPDSLPNFLYFQTNSGLAGTVLVYEIVGALARRGAPLDEVYVMLRGNNCEAPRYCQSWT